jgi:SAM-dependent methyltransferase
MHTSYQLNPAGDAPELSRLFRYAVQNGLYPSEERLSYYCHWIFEGISLAGCSVLDVGCGHGLIPMYAACRGARRAVGLEPETEGAANGMIRAFGQAVASLGLRSVEPCHQTVEQYARVGERFDVVTLCQVINHLDEEACSRLHYDPTARSDYLERLAVIRDLVAAGGWLVITDCGRRNLFRSWVAAGLPHPFVPTIEWKKHQEPQIWADLLEAAGFQEIRTHWRTPNRLRRLSWALGNRIAARCLTSEFRITARRLPAATSSPAWRSAPELTAARQNR